MAPTQPTPDTPDSKSSDSKTPYEDILSAISTGIKKSTSRAGGRAVDLNKCCGVSVDTGSPCPKPLRDCQIHSRAQKRAVVGRSCSYDMLIIPERPKRSSLFRDEVEDNGEGSSTGASKADRKGVDHIYMGEWNPQAKDLIVKKASPKRKDRATTEDAEAKSVKGEIMDTVEDDEKKTPPPKSAAGAKAKKRGPKAWTSLENEIAKDIREHARHKLPTIEHLEVARKLIEKVRASNQADNKELPGGSYRVMGWGG